jgi:hypothetical protein
VDYANQKTTAVMDVAYVGGIRHANYTVQRVQSVDDAVVPTAAALQKRHGWDENTFPSFESG